MSNAQPRPRRSVLLSKPLPMLHDVERIDAVFSFRNESIQFEVPRKYWPRTWAAMQPAVRDYSPAKWRVLGDLAITTGHAASFYIGMYTVPRALGAFSCGPTFEERVYYRGGNSAKLKKALTAAYKASKQRQ